MKIQYLAMLVCIILKNFCTTGESNQNVFVDCLIDHIILMFDLYFVLLQLSLVFSPFICFMLKCLIGF